MWMYNEFLFFYEKEPYKQFIWRYMGQTIQIIATTSFLLSVDSLVALIFVASSRTKKAVLQRSGEGGMNGIQLDKATGIQKTTLTTRFLAIHLHEFIV